MSEITFSFHLPDVFCFILFPELLYCETATRPEWSSFCATEWSKKAGTEGGKVAQKSHFHFQSVYVQNFIHHFFQKFAFFHIHGAQSFIFKIHLAQN